MKYFNWRLGACLFLCSVAPFSAEAGLDVNLRNLTAIAGGSSLQDATDTELQGFLGMSAGYPVGPMRHARSYIEAEIARRASEARVEVTEKADARKAVEVEAAPKIEETETVRQAAPAGNTRGIAADNEQLKSLLAQRRAIVSPPKARSSTSAAATSSSPTFSEEDTLSVERKRECNDEPHGNSGEWW